MGRDKRYELLTSYSLGRDYLRERKDCSPFKQTAILVSISPVPVTLLHSRVFYSHDNTENEMPETNPSVKYQLSGV